MAGFDWPTIMIGTGGNILNTLALNALNPFFIYGWGWGIINSLC